MPIKTCVFDAYGTLFDVAAAAREAAAEPGGEALAELWPQLAAHWRTKQLQYTWLRAVTGDHKDFWDVTQDGHLLSILRFAVSNQATNGDGQVVGQERSNHSDGQHGDAHENLCNESF